MAHLTVPGAEHLEAACLGDLTTTGTVRPATPTPAGFTGFGGLSVPGTVNPASVPGIQLDGYFPDTSTFNTTHGWNHDAQFVIRLPRHWNGGLVVAGPPGIRRQYASDVIISDTVLAKGYAYASTDKGNSGPTLYTDGDKPGDAIAEWHTRVTELTIAAKKVLAQRYHRSPARTYIAGFSAAGYLARWQLENRPGLYDGGIAWSGVLITPERNLLSYLPTALRHYPEYAATGPLAAHQALLDRGLPGRLRADLGVQLPRASGTRSSDSCARSSTPTYDGDTQPGHPFCASGTPDCDADYDLDDAAAGGQGRHREHLPDRPHRQAPAAAAGDPRHRRDPARLPPLRHMIANQGRRHDDSALRGRRRQPLRGPLPPAPRPAATHAALLPGRIRPRSSSGHRTAPSRRPVTSWPARPPLTWSTPAPCDPRGATTGPGTA